MKGVIGQNPLFLPKSGFFLYDKMNVARNLKLFVFFSIGVHLLGFSILCVLLPDLKFPPLPRLTLEVSLLSVEGQEKELRNKVERVFQEIRSPHLKEVNVKEGLEVQRKEENSVKIIEKKEEEIQSESLPIFHGKIEASHVEKVELPTSSTEQRTESILSIQSATKGVSLNESKSVSIESAKKEREEEGRVILASFGHSIPPTLPYEQPKTVLKEPTPTERGILFAQPRYAENPKPLYPKEAKRKGYQGEVLLRVEVLSNGTVGEIEVKRSSGYEILDRSALTAVKEWKFVPAKRGETTIPVWVHIPIAFQLR